MSQIAKERARNNFQICSTADVPAGCVARCRDSSASPPIRNVALQGDFITQANGMPFEPLWHRRVEARNFFAHSEGGCLNMTINSVKIRRFSLNAQGWCMDIQQRHSPNYDSRPDGSTVSLLVIHNISLPPDQFGGTFIADFFCNQLEIGIHPYFEQLADLKVSAHFLIRRDGGTLQFVSTDARAWHAGVSIFSGRPCCNDFSIGIELEGTDRDTFTEVQYAALTDLTKALQLHYPLTDVVGHQHIAEGRKTDPGGGFDWQYFNACLHQERNFDLTLPELRFPFLNELA